MQYACRQLRTIITLIATGLIFYNGQTSSGGSDFVSFGLDQGVPEFRFNLGSGAAVIRADKPITFGEWHTVKLSRNKWDIIIPFHSQSNKK